MPFEKYLEQYYIFSLKYYFHLHIDMHTKIRSYKLQIRNFRATVFSIIYHSSHIYYDISYSSSLIKKFFSLSVLSLKNIKDTTAVYPL